MLRTAVLVVVACGGFGAVSPQDNAVQKEVERLHIPEKLMPKDRQALFMARGEGVQIYVGEAKAGKLEWALQAPEAALLDYQTGEKFGVHSGGPTWIDSDGGKLTGKRVEAAEAPNAHAVEWLLLEVKAEGGGRFSKVTHVQRVDTWGGRPPAVAPAKAGDKTVVRYEATYVFLGKR